MKTVALHNHETQIYHPIRNGLIAGVGGGIVFGMMMATMGTLRMIAQMMGSSSPVLGFLIHMMISAAIGAGYGLIARKIPYRYSTHTIAGALYGAVWWIIGPLVVMPMMMGMTDMIFNVGSRQWMSLMGHLIFGVITGLLFVRLSRP